MPVLNPPQKMRPEIIPIATTATSERLDGLKKEVAQPVQARCWAEWDSAMCSSSQVVRAAAYDPPRRTGVDPGNEWRPPAASASLVRSAGIAYCHR